MAPRQVGCRHVGGKMSEYRIAPVVVVSEWYLYISVLTMPLFSLVAGWMEAKSLLSAPAVKIGGSVPGCEYQM